MKKIFRITFPSTFVTLFSKLECKQQTETRLFQIGIQSGLTNYPLLFDIRVSGLEGTTFSSSGAFGWLDGNLQATGVYPWHFFVFLANRLLNFWQDSRTHRSCNTLKNKINISITTHLSTMKKCQIFCYDKYVCFSMGDPNLDQIVLIAKTIQPLMLLSG